MALWDSSRMKEESTGGEHEAPSRDSICPRGQRHTADSSHQAAPRLLVLMAGPSRQRWEQRSLLHGLGGDCCERACISWRGERERQGGERERELIRPNGGGRVS